MLLGEPLVWTLLAAAFLGAALARRPLPAAAAVAGWLLFVAFVRWPIRVNDAPSPPAGLAPALQACVSEPPSPSQPLRLLTWRAGAARDPAPILSLRPGLVVLHDITDDTLPRAIAAATAGEFVHSPADRTAIVVPGGRFRACSGVGTHSTWPLPGTTDRAGAAMLAVAELPRGGAVPVLATRYDRPATLSELGTWPGILRTSTAVVSGLAGALQTGSLIVAGDTGSHGTFRGLHGLMASAPLQPAPGLPTWPAHLGPVPTPTLYHGDRVWYGGHWQVAGVATVRLGASQNPSGHLAYVATLQPRPDPR